MKKIKLSLIIIICFFIIFGTSCKNNEEIQTTAQTMEYAVAYELSNIEDVDSLDEETAKALSIVIRTRLINNPEESPQNIDKSNIDEKYLNIVNKTSNQILNYNNNIAEVSYAYTEEEEWSSEIKKSEILSYMMKNKISLSNISDIEKLENDSGELEFLVIGGKSIPFSSLKESFNLKTNKITSVKNKNSSIVITGTTENNKNLFKYKNIDNKNNLKYDEILKNQYNDYTLITI